MPGRIASLDDLPPSVVLPVSEAARLAINAEFRYMHDDNSEQREITGAAVEGKYLVVRYERPRRDGCWATWEILFDRVNGMRLYGPSQVTQYTPRPERSAWYLHTGKADLDYENQP